MLATAPEDLGVGLPTGPLTTGAMSLLGSRLHAYDRSVLETVPVLPWVEGTLGPVFDSAPHAAIRNVAAASRTSR
jgi:hypothetical protein